MSIFLIDEFLDLMKVDKVQKRNDKEDSEYVDDVTIGMVHDHLRKSDLNRFFNFANDGARLEINGNNVSFTLYGAIF